MNRLGIFLPVAVVAWLATAPAPALAQQTRFDAPKAAAGRTTSAKKLPGGYRLRPGQKQCRSKLPDGSVKTWTCGKDQPCCVNHTFGLYTCGSLLLRCL